MVPGRVDAGVVIGEHGPMDAPPTVDKVREAGVGTGYNAALLAHLVGPSGHVTTSTSTPTWSRAPANTSPPPAPPTST